MGALQKNDLCKLAVLAYLIVCIFIYERVPRTVSEYLSNIYFVLKYLEILIFVAIHFFLFEDAIGTDAIKISVFQNEIAYAIEMAYTFVLQMMIFQTDFFFTMTVWMPLFFIIITALNVFWNFEYTMTGI